MPKPVLPANRRRKGFESVRKGYCSANARPMFFEKELLYCKLTVASDIRKGLLRVSFGAVRSRCRCALKKVFSLSGCFAWAKKLFFSAKQKVFRLQKALRFALKSLSFSQPKHRSFGQLFTVLKNRLSRTKNFLLHKPFLACFKNRPFLQTKSLSFAQILP